MSHEVLVELLAALAAARSLVDVNIAAGIAHDRLTGQQWANAPSQS